MLVKPQFVADLKFKGIPYSKQANKPELIQLLTNKLNVPGDGRSPAFHLPGPPAPSVADAPSQWCIERGGA